MPKLKSKSRIQNLNLLYNKENIPPRDFKKLQLEQAVAEENDLISKKKKELEEAKVELAILSREVDNARRKLHHKSEKLNAIRSQTNETVNKNKT